MRTDHDDRQDDAHHQLLEPQRDVEQPPVTAGLGAPGVDVVVTVHQRWAEIVGEEVADHVRPLGIEAGRLKVAADGPAWASHLRWSEAEIVGRLADLLGPDQITGIVVRVVRG